MTGRELILYILINGLEDEKMPDWTTIEDFAERRNVGVATVLAWIELGHVKGVEIQGKFYIYEKSYIGESHE